MIRTCEFDGCSKKHFGRGFCNTHYKRWLVHGDPSQGSLTREQRFWKYVSKTDTCWLWIGGRDVRGYGVFTINGQDVRAHRFSYQLHNGHAAPNFVLHSCDNPPCVNPAHLSNGTQTDNMADMVERNRRKGEKSGNAVLTESQVRIIRDTPKQYGDGVYLAGKYGVTPSTIWSIRASRIWKHI